MKTNLLTATVTGSRKQVQVSNPFTWVNVAKLYNLLSFGAIQCTGKDAKIYSLMFLVLYLALQIGYLYDMAVFQEGGLR